MRGRFAPSPTGDLHLGNARTALLGWLQARSEGGRFILRVEDLDPGRARVEYLGSHMADLRWLGLDWDEGPDVGGAFAPYVQSQRTSYYEAALARLVELGLVYECFCSRREIAAAASAPHGEGDEGPPYPGTCAQRSDPTPGRAASALRFRVPADPVVVNDHLQGEKTFLPGRETGDFVVWRKDGVAAYQLAVVVDDAAMRMTHVLRGADLLRSTARQILLYQALDQPQPHWIHVPLLLDRDGGRFSKRYGALSLTELREAREPPERIVGWLAHTCGLASKGEHLTPTDLIERYDLARLPRPDTPVDLPDWALRITGTSTT